MTQFMIDKGHNHLAFIAEPDSYAVAIDRIEGFKRVCLKNNVNEFHIFNARPERNEIMEVVKKMKEQEVFPSAIITSDSMLNINLLSVLYHYNIRIPDDVMTATFNDSFINESASPPQQL